MTIAVWAVSRIVFRHGRIWNACFQMHKLDTRQAPPKPIADLL